ncbi:MAG: helical backbone metal receptor [Planctomycetota bacterium]|nr:helical backbone metal receptor [Planctomycetota bacterium]
MQGNRQREGRPAGNPRILAPACGQWHAPAVASARIVSLVPSSTESVCDLGAGARLVGCTRYCTEPQDQLAAVVRVGGTKNPQRERIAALQPDLVLANAEENRAEDIAWLRARFAVLEQTPRSVVAAAAALRELAERLLALDAAQPFLLRIEAQLAAAAAGNLDREPVPVFYAIWKKPWMSVNRDTFVHDVLRVAGAHNVCADASARYPEVAAEAVVAERPAIVLLPSEPWAFSAAERDELASARTFGAAQLLLCDGRDFCWHGTRMADGLGRAAELVSRARASRR